MDINKGIADWCARHRHPINAMLHAIGIPMTFAAGYIAYKYSVIWGIVVFVVGYAVQFIGHGIEGNEAGETILIKKLLKKRDAE
ncbi:MAG TPA: DUF962 domain-containing protein [bacterium]|nr:DUF962 domain-containing protein [bacterium]